jgi:hypothetical protein
LLRKEDGTAVKSILVENPADLEVNLAFDKIGPGYFLKSVHTPLLAELKIPC